MTDSTAEGEKTVTAVEYLENQLALEKEAADILPGKFENCTYKLGHIRQAVYACKTCSNLDPDHPAGMCYGCSIACHADHEILELFPKRHFRCDCGLKSKFGGAACELDMESKAGSRNDDNAYNHNFVGKYCRYVTGLCHGSSLTGDTDPLRCLGVKYNMIQKKKRQPCIR
jgi:E3 ubiquitin-protein ligase UBR7